MFEEQEQRSLSEARSKEQRVKKFTFDWSMMTVVELIGHMDAIKKHLPALGIKDMNMEEEVLLQLHSLRSLQNEQLEDDTVPLNQRVQLANSVSATLKTLSELQAAVYSSERHKKIEALLVQTLNKLPEAVASSFLDEYERVLRKDGHF